MRGGITARSVAVGMFAAVVSLMVVTQAGAADVERPAPPAAPSSDVLPVRLVPAVAPPAPPSEAALESRSPRRAAPPTP